MRTTTLFSGTLLLATARLKALLATSAPLAASLLAIASLTPLLQPARPLAAQDVTAATAAARIAPAAGTTFIRGGWLFDGVGVDVVRNPGILVRNGMILSVSVVPKLATHVVELGENDYILPGLFDLHAHYAIDLFGDGRVDATEVSPIIFLANGVTSTFPGGEVDPVGMMSARRKIDAGDRVGPRIHSSGPYYGTARPGWSHQAMTRDSIRKDVDYWAAQGARGFKAKGIRPEQLEALIEQAHRWGLTVTGHLDSGARGSVNPPLAIGTGIDRIEHFIGGETTPPTQSAYASLEALEVPSAQLDSAIRRYLEHGVYFDATISAYGYWGERASPILDFWTDERAFFTPHAREVIEQRLPRRPNAQFDRIFNVKLKTIKAFYDAGGAHLITLGTDHPSWGEYLSGFGAHRELHAFVTAGIPAAAALKIGTINGARALGVSGKLGTIEPGKFADLFVVTGNPLADITNTRNVRLVMRGGDLYDAPKLLDAVRGKLGPASAEEDDWWKGNARLGR